MNWTLLQYGRQYRANLRRAEQEGRDVATIRDKRLSSLKNTLADLEAEEHSSGPVLRLVVSLSKILGIDNPASTSTWLASDFR